MKLKILFDINHKHMVVRQCVFSNDEPDLHFVEIVSCSKDKQIVYFLLLRIRQLKIGSIWVKLRSIRGEMLKEKLVKAQRKTGRSFQLTHIKFFSKIEDRIISVIDRPILLDLRSLTVR